MSSYPAPSGREKHRLHRTEPNYCSGNSALISDGNNTTIVLFLLFFSLKSAIYVYLYSYHPPVGVTRIVEVHRAALTYREIGQHGLVLGVRQYTTTAAAAAAAASSNAAAAAAAAAAVAAE